VVCQGIDLIDKGLLKKTYTEFYQDTQAAAKRQYVNSSSTKYTPIADYGQFFPEVIKEVDQVYEH